MWGCDGTMKHSFIKEVPEVIICGRCRAGVIASSHPSSLCFVMLSHTSLLQITFLLSQWLPLNTSQLGVLNGGWKTPGRRLGLLISVTPCSCQHHYKQCCFPQQLLLTPLQLLIPYSVFLTLMKPCP